MALTGNCPPRHLIIKHLACKNASTLTSLNAKHAWTSSPFRVEFHFLIQLQQVWTHCCRNLIDIWRSFVSHESILRSRRPVPHRWTAINFDHRCADARQPIVHHNVAMLRTFGLHSLSHCLPLADRILVIADNRLDVWSNAVTSWHIRQRHSINHQLITSGRRRPARAAWFR